MKIGLIREGKTPPDSRVPLTPQQCSLLLQEPGIQIVVEPSPGRCFSDEEYRQSGVPLSENLLDCDVLMGVKEVPKKMLLPGKTYLFFSHTIKKQPSNQQLLWAILDKKIRLIDYEALTDGRGKRLIAFGKFAGMMGAHNGLWTFAQRTKQFVLPRMNSFVNYAAARDFYKKTVFPNLKIVVTGTGRVATGAVMVLQDMGFSHVKPQDFLKKQFSKPVFTQLTCEEYVARKDGSAFDKKDFYQNPQLYKSSFAPYTQVADIMINGIFWDSRSPAFFTLAQMASPNFRMKTIADVTCDLMPGSSIPSTIKATTIAEPVFGFDPISAQETEPYQPGTIDMMTIDNLPNELPRDASTAFGLMFIEHVLPEFKKKKSDVLERATVAENGILGKHFKYLEDYAGM